MGNGMEEGKADWVDKVDKAERLIRIGIGTKGTRQAIEFT